jgi:hypothetical protein
MIVQYEGTKMPEMVKLLKLVNENEWKLTARGKWDGEPRAQSA